MIRIIGILGPAASGKTTVAERLVAKYGARRYSFSDPIKPIVKKLYGLSDEQLYGTQDQKEAIIPTYGCSARDLMHQVGETVREVMGEDIWARELLRKIVYDEAAWSDAGESAGPNGFLAVIDDVRLKVEAAAIRWFDTRSFGFVSGLMGYPRRTIGDVTDVWKLDRPDARAYSKVDPNHKTECEWTEAEHDAVLNNPHDLQHLYDNIDELAPAIGLVSLPSWKPVRCNATHYFGDVPLSYGPSACVLEAGTHNDHLDANMRWWWQRTS